MYVTSLTCGCVDFDDEMVVSLTRLTMSALDNSSKVSFAVAYLECVSVGLRKLSDVVIVCFEFLAWWSDLFC